MAEGAARRPRAGSASSGLLFGGGIVNQLAVELGAELDAAVPFYGAQPSAGDAVRIKAPVNAQYGELDARITPGWPAFDAALSDAHVPHERAHLQEAANHGFHNDTTPRATTRPRQRAWSRTLGLVQQVFERLREGGGGGGLPRSSWPGLSRPSTR